ncbi:hypothetical protein H2199_008925 [Coniosporium tulheliwenetii]|uniref:Uncharacterized protein n=1 Tax=Coniosporium tulheliwenetii TaxID=3383036 RepID=A0ACC2YH20_9PEZI|nr:hypothetical protein H2199_008925 [Cladosporium sp. JES 115]
MIDEQKETVCSGEKLKNWPTIFALATRMFSRDQVAGLVVKILSDASGRRVHSQELPYLKVLWDRKLQEDDSATEKKTETSRNWDDDGQPTWTD